MALPPPGFAIGPEISIEPTFCTESGADLPSRQGEGHSLAFHDWSVQDPLDRTNPVKHKSFVMQYAFTSQQADAEVPLLQGMSESGAISPLG